MKEDIAKLNALTAILFYVAAVFQIVDEHFIVGGLFFVSASCFAVSARKNSKAYQENDTDKTEV